MIELVPAGPQHIGPIANRMRAVDRAEIAALGHAPKQGLRLYLRASPFALTATVDGSPHAMFGVAPVAAWRGEPWFLGTDEVYGQGRALLSLGQRAVDEMQRQYPKLANAVSVGNHRSIRLLKRWGFIVESDVRTIGGMDFHPFWRTG